jgi:uncharacterized membrane protein
MRKSLEAISLAALAFMFWVYWNAQFGLGRLPERIPIHFNFAGQPDAWGKPTMLPIMPVVALVLYLLLTVLARFPSIFNYPVEVTAENRPWLEALALDMIAWIKMEMVCLFAWIQWSTIEVARQGRGGLSPALLPVFLVTLFGTLAWFITAMRRAAAGDPGLQPR